MLTSRQAALAAVLFTAPLVACAPNQQGTDQCRDSAVDLVALKDAKYAALPEAQGGLSAAVREDIDGVVDTFMAAPSTPVAGCALAVTHNNQIAYLQAMDWPIRPRTATSRSQRLPRSARSRRRSRRWDSWRWWTRTP